jgi:xylulose-5-phosphate/fructose-6-phosphate phosphoketolase
LEKRFFERSPKVYPWLIQRLTYRRTNHDNIHVRGNKDEGAITTPFDRTVLNDLDCFYLVMDTIDRLPQTGDSTRSGLW